MKLAKDSIMTFKGIFHINDADFSPLTIYGVGTFMAFSGNREYRNRRGFVTIPHNGPLPPGKYWIVDRPAGGIKTRMWTALKDMPTQFTNTPTDHSTWFALYRDDGQINDRTWINGVERGNFRLHPVGPMGVSEGCITLQHHSDFHLIRNKLLRTKKEKNHETELQTYGYTEVVTYAGEICSSPV